jgi:3-oxoacyl-[acyl-carrier protein] reductase
MKLKNQVAIVTGGGRGIGKEICKKLASDGCNIVTFSRTLSEIKNIEKEIKKLGVKALCLVADVRNKKEVSIVVKKCLNQFGKIDILVNNAGVAEFKPFLEIKDAQWNEIIDINLKGVIICTKLVLPHMVKSGYGRIINISSGAGQRGFSGLAVYCASKFGVRGLTQSLAEEIENQDIKTYTVCPGAVATSMYFNMIPDADPKDLLKPEEVAEVVYSLCLAKVKTSLGADVNVTKRY